MQRCSTLSRRWRGLAQILGGSTSCCYASANDGHTHACARNEPVRTASYARAPTQLSMRNALMHMQTPPSAHPTRPGKLRLTWRSTARIIRLARGDCTESTRPVAPCVVRAAWLPRRSLWLPRRRAQTTATRGGRQVARQLGRSFASALPRGAAAAGRGAVPIAPASSPGPRVPSIPHLRRDRACP
jgi:hypothetical protein